MRVKQLIQFYESIGEVEQASGLRRNEKLSEQQFQAAEKNLLALLNSGESSKKRKFIRHLYRLCELGRELETDIVRIDGKT